MANQVSVYIAGLPSRMAVLLAGMANQVSVDMAVLPARTAKRVSVDIAVLLVRMTSHVSENIKHCLQEQSTKF